jgi:hypothetical protein
LKGKPFKIKGNTFSAKEKLPNVIFEPPNVSENTVLVDLKRINRKNRRTIGIRALKRAKQHGTPNFFDLF